MRNFELVKRSGHHDIWSASQVPSIKQLRADATSGCFRLKGLDNRRGVLSSIRGKALNLMKSELAIYPHSPGIRCYVLKEEK